MNFTFPGGAVRHIVISATAGNVVTDLSPGAGKRWMLLGFRLTLVANATVVTRNQRIFRIDAVGNILDSPRWGGNTVASATTILASTSMLAPAGGSFGSDTAIFGVHPVVDMIGPTDIFRTSVLAGVAGDSYSGVVTVLEASE